MMKVWIGMAGAMQSAEASGILVAPMPCNFHLFVIGSAATILMDTLSLALASLEGKKQTFPTKKLQSTILSTLRLAAGQ